MAFAFLHFAPAGNQAQKKTPSGKGVLLNGIGDDLFIWRETLGLDAVKVCGRIVANNAGVAMS